MGASLIYFNYVAGSSNVNVYLDTTAHLWYYINVVKVKLEYIYFQSTVP